MKKKIFCFLIVSFLLVITFSIFSYSKEINDTISLSINLFIKNVFPSLFPMFVISNLLVSIKTPKFLGNIFKDIFYKLFKVKGEGSFVFFMSMISGFPSSSIYVKDLLDKKLIDIYDASKILTFTFFSNPLFIINTVGIMFLNNKVFGFYILISHIIGNILTGILFRNIYEPINNVKNISLKNSIKDFYYDIINNDTLNYNVVFAFDKTINLSYENYVFLINLCKNYNIYIVLFDNKYDFSDYNNVNVIMFDLYDEYLMVDRVHLNSDGNKKLVEVMDNYMKKKD